VKQKYSSTLKGMALFFLFFALSISAYTLRSLTVGPSSQSRSGNGAYTLKNVSIGKPLNGETMNASYAITYGHLAPVPQFSIPELQLVDLNALHLRAELEVTSCANDEGNPLYTFDGITDGLVDLVGFRSQAVNPAWIQFTFDQPATIYQAAMVLGGGNDNIWMLAAAQTQADMDNKTGTYQEVIPYGDTTDLTWDTAQAVMAVAAPIWRFTVDRLTGDNFVHIWELKMWEEKSNDTISDPVIEKFNLAVSEKTDTSTSITWTNITNLHDYASFDVYRDGVYMGSVSDYNYTDTTVIPDSTYEYTIIGNLTDGGVENIGRSLWSVAGVQQNILPISPSMITSFGVSDIGEIACFDNAFQFDGQGVMASTTNPAWIQVDFAEPQRVTMARILVPEKATYGSHSWRLEAADTESDLINQANSYVSIIPEWTQVEKGEFTEHILTSPVEKRFYRFHVRNDLYYTAQIAELELYSDEIIQKEIRNDYNIMVIHYNPYLSDANGDSISYAQLKTRQTFDMKTFADSLFKTMYQLSGGAVHFHLDDDDYHSLQEWPPSAWQEGWSNDTLYNVEEYENRYIEDPNEQKESEGYLVDIPNVFNDPRFNIVNRINEGTLDMVYILIPERTIMNESAFVGDRAYWINGSAYQSFHVGDIPFQRTLLVGQRIPSGSVIEGIGGFLHSIGHGIENLMGSVAHLYFPRQHRVEMRNNFNINDGTRTLVTQEVNDFVLFTLAGEVSNEPLPSNDYYLYGTAGSPGFTQVGSMHFPPFAPQNYGYYALTNTVKLDTISGEWDYDTSSCWEDITNLSAGEQDFLVHRGNTIESDLELQAVLSIESDAPNTDAGVLFRVNNYNEHGFDGYYVGLSAGNNEVILARQEQTNQVNLQTVPTPLNPNTMYNLGIRMIGSVIEVRLNNEIVISEYYDNTYSYGTAGLLTHSTGFFVDTIRVVPIAKTYADVWYNYPNLDFDSFTPKYISPYDFTSPTSGHRIGEEHLYMQWFYDHIPSNSGIHSGDDLVTGKTYRGLLNTWFPYFFDSNNFTGAPVYDVAFPAPADTEAPSAPTSFNSSNVTSSSVKISWIPSTDNTGVTRYDIIRNNEHLRTSFFTTFTDVNLDSGTTYTYEIIARDGSGNLSLPLQGNVTTN